MERTIDIEAEVPLAPPVELKDGRCPTCGSPMKARSSRDHRLYWAIMRKAYKNWPEQHWFRPLTVEHLHGWLLIESGHREGWNLTAASREAAKENAQEMWRATSRRIHCVRTFQLDSGQYLIVVPGAMAYEDVGKAKYEAVRKAVFETIESILNVTIDTLKRETHHDTADNSRARA